MSRRTNKMNRQMGSVQQSQSTIDISNAQNVSCDKCGNHTFETVVLIKRLSAIISPTGQEALVPIQVFSCNACGWVNKEFLPRKEREEAEEQPTQSNIIT